MSHRCPASKYILMQPNPLTTSYTTDILPGQRLANVFSNSHIVNNAGPTATTQWILPLHLKSSYRQYVYEWVWLRSNKTLFIKTGSGIDMTYRLHSLLAPARGQ
jgi:hypothetical protein